MAADAGHKAVASILHNNCPIPEPPRMQASATDIMRLGVLASRIWIYIRFTAFELIRRARYHRSRCGSQSKGALPPLQTHATSISGLAIRPGAIESFFGRGGLHHDETATDQEWSLPPLWPLATGFTLIFQIMADPRFPLPIFGSVLAKVEASMPATFGSFDGDSEEKARLLFDWTRPTAAENFTIEDRYAMNCTLSPDITTTSGGRVQFCTHSRLQNRRAVHDEPVWESKAYMAVPATQEKKKSDFRPKTRYEDSEAESFSKQGELSLSPKDCLQFAWLFGDANPVHLSILTARLLGQRGVIAHGLVGANFALDIMSRSIPNSTEMAIPKIQFWGRCPIAGKFARKLWGKELSVSVCLNLLRPLNVPCTADVESTAWALSASGETATISARVRSQDQDKPAIALSMTISQASVRA